MLAIGALGVHVLPQGVYIYVGSAWGPGGIRARLGRHLRGGGALHWHIDYLRLHALPLAAWIAVDQCLECAWAKQLLHVPGARVGVPGFGASDCRCVTHLIHFTGFPVSLELACGEGPIRLNGGADGGL